jgi:hypothetical protein
VKTEETKTQVKDKVPAKEAPPSKPSFFSKLLCCTTKKPKEEDSFSNILPPIGKY